MITLLAVMCEKTEVLKFSFFEFYHSFTETLKGTVITKIWNYYSEKKLKKFKRTIVCFEIYLQYVYINSI